MEFQKTEKREIPNNPKIVSLKNLRYAKVINDRDGGKGKKFERKVIFGDHIE